MGVQGDGIWTGTNGDTVLFVEVVYDLVTLPCGDDLNQPETGDAIDERSRELC